ncbi:unnamed protein product [Bemisia tabaci]|uniref:Zinc/iron permease n=1 Tax=Bemisia tabaci TaxID=7038 RepID=A0A9P0AMI3_BEMTA|nr:PREDICTED: zinc transporter ZIP13 homolog [Bemisia tabaci]CAH0394763.1 unnamed protein product [Bemisia tabaci]
MCTAFSINDTDPFVMSSFADFFQTASFSSVWNLVSQSFDYQPWILSVIASFIVGLSGIFPLLVIPIEDSESLKTGASAKTLKVLLSFAVGGLLGDVFLHLLPEAWSNSGKQSARSNPSMFCGLWVLTGMLVFIVMEKAFAGQQDSSPMLVKQVEPSKTTICSDDNANKAFVKTPSTIQISGYLNLAANCIDNFTHGLAVGGSFLLSARVGCLTTFAILVHEIPHEVGDFAILLRSGFTRWEAAYMQLYTASAGVVGAMTAIVFSGSSNSIEAKTSWILPFTAGGFLHIALVSILPELQQEKNTRESLKQMVSLGAGITVMAILTFMIE